MKKTEPGSSAVRKAAMSALRSSAGPAVWTSGASSSAATMWASEVLPSPGGPASRTWSSGSLAPARGLDEDLELAGDLLLVDEVGEPPRAQRAVELLVAAARRRRPSADRARRSRLDVRAPLDARSRAMLTPPPGSPALRSAAPISSSALSPSAPSSSFSASAGV